MKVARHHTNISDINHLYSGRRYILCVSCLLIGCASNWTAKSLSVTSNSVSSIANDRTVYINAQTSLCSCVLVNVQFHCTTHFPGKIPFAMSSGHACADT